MDLAGGELLAARVQRVREPRDAVRRVIENAGRNAGFDGADFSGDVSFGEARFERNAWFSGAVFRREADFARARFLGAKHFDNIDMVSSRPRDARALQDMVVQAVG